MRIVPTDIAIDLAYGLYVTDANHPLARLFGFRRGQIVIPSRSIQRAIDRLRGRRITLAETLRHEYGHAYAHTAGRRVRGNPDFRKAFGADHDVNARAMYRHDCVSGFAVANPAEDFAECFAAYLRAGGRLPAYSSRPVLRAKMLFVASLATPERGRERGRGRSEGERR